MPIKILAMIKVRRIALPAPALAHCKTTRDAQNMQMNNRKDEGGTRRAASPRQGLTSA
jgi:hypothetical protein